MTPDRMLMLILFVPLLIRLLTGKLGGIGAVDVLILLYGAWIFLSLMVWHGGSYLQFAGMTVVEMVGGYLFGRAMIRSEADYRAFFRQFYHALLILLPFAFIELFTDRQLINDLVGKVFGTFPNASRRAALGAEPGAGGLPAPDPLRSGLLARHRQLLLPEPRGVPPGRCSGPGSPSS